MRQMKRQLMKKALQKGCAVSLAAGLLALPVSGWAGETREYTGNKDDRVTISGGASYCFGPTTSLTGNSITVNYTGGSGGPGDDNNLLTCVFGAYTDAVAATVSGNSVIIRSGSVFSSVYGGYSLKGSANGNTVIINDGSMDCVDGGTAKVNATGNTVIINGGSVVHVCGGSANGTATGNTVIINGGSVVFKVSGGSANGTATGNTVTISGSPILTTSNIYGGAWGVDAWTGNTLNIKTSGLSVRGVYNFQYYNFYLPPSLGDGGTVLTATDTAKISGSTIGIGFTGNTTALKPGDQVTLLSAGTLTSTVINPRASALSGVAKLYDFALSINGNKLNATVSGVRQNPQVKALSEGQVSSAAFLNQGADMLSGQGLQNARSAAAGGGGQAAGFAAMGGNSLRYETGSHIDVNGFSLVVGAAKQQATASGETTSGMFLETGWGNYSTYNQFATMSPVRSDGNTNYFGAGWLGRTQGNKGHYHEGSLRVGRTSNKFHSNDFGVNAVDYDVHTPYYGAHIGIGQEQELGNNQKRDSYAKLLWTHQNGSSATVAGDNFDFADTNSLRGQIGTKWLFKTSEHTTLRTGLAYQYEFDGKANATVNGSSIVAPSMQGGTGIVEIGLTSENPGNKGAKLDIALQGFCGKMRGIAGSVQAVWKF